MDVTRTALVTGANRGIGLAVAGQLSGHQVDVLVNNAGSGREWPAALPRETRKRRQTRWLACHAARRRATGGLFKDRKQIE
jgi:NAD(P)-dependent dehydrogenase (short-subunit alcohol dehydrogenase family)